jgi:hypothetical protein
MMKQLLFGLTAAISMTAASPASAADWWLLSRPPAGDSVLFADEEALDRAPDGTVSLHVLRIDREGRSTETVEKVSCASSDKLSRFACAAPDERDNYGLILASMSPAEAARMLFEMGSVGAERRGGDEL